MQFVQAEAPAAREQTRLTSPVRTHDIRPQTSARKHTRAQTRTQISCGAAPVLRGHQLCLTLHAKVCLWEA